MKTAVLIVLFLIPTYMDAQKLPAIDIDRYQGNWFVIGFKPSKLDKNWTDICETYTWDAAKKRYDVFTTYKTELGGEEKSITQKLLPVKDSGNARWIARIWFFIRADYVIYKIADDYSYVVVGHPKRKYLYIMSRSPRMEQELYLQLVDYAVTLGYHREEIQRDPQFSRTRKG